MVGFLSIETRPAIPRLASPAKSGGPGKRSAVQPWIPACAGKAMRVTGEKMKRGIRLFFKSLRCFPIPDEAHPSRQPARNRRLLRLHRKGTATKVPARKTGGHKAAATPALGPLAGGSSNGR